MSKFDFLRDKDGLFNCKKCSRRFLTKTVLEVHSTNLHKNENVTELAQFIQPPIKIDKSASQKNSGSEKESTICNIYLGSKTEQEVHTSKLQSMKIKKVKAKKIKKLKAQKIKKEEANVKKYSSPHQCKECNKTLSNQWNLQIHINNVHKHM